jgi:pimeloyl-ACP methyl ester carboxylesterase
MAEAVNKVKEQIGSHRAILIGHSMGCRVIMEAFQQSPNNIVGLVHRFLETDHMRRIPFS